ncbi:unnamed protein product [Thlaspi arvense]|uniref:GPN-loop GTPase n=1 Tax=Thlaspi arvense TaxID=13288 RepID=A0AAU9RSW1_THLAR|nr:unnamed protein product [Thlaspi arvense]
MVVISVIEKCANQLDYDLVDTPEAFASTFLSVSKYVVDTPRSSNPQTFMSNMLYACSILYKTRLPLVLTFNKTDVAQDQFVCEIIAPLHLAILKQHFCQRLYSALFWPQGQDY